MPDILAEYFHGVLAWRRQILSIGFPATPRRLPLSGSGARLHPQFSLFQKYATGPQFVRCVRSAVQVAALALILSAAGGLPEGWPQGVGYSAPNAPGI